MEAETSIKNAAVNKAIIIIIEARIISKDFNFSATVIDISEGGVGILSGDPIETGSRVFISLFPIIEESICGIAVWSHYIEKVQKYYYRIGFESQISDFEKLRVMGFPKRSEFVTKILA